MVRFHIGPTVVPIELVRLMPRRPPWPSPGDADSDFTAGSSYAEQTASGIANVGTAGSSASTSTRKVPGQ